jgi:hypothetical protein
MTAGEHCPSCLRNGQLGFTDATQGCWLSKPGYNGLHVFPSLQPCCPREADGAEKNLESLERQCLQERYRGIRGWAEKAHQTSWPAGEEAAPGWRLEGQLLAGWGSLSSPQVLLGSLSPVELCRSSSHHHDFVITNMQLSCYVSMLVCYKKRDHLCW